MNGVVARAVEAARRTKKERCRRRSENDYERKGERCEIDERYVKERSKKGQRKLEDRFKKGQRTTEDVERPQSTLAHDYL